MSDHTIVRVGKRIYEGRKVIAEFMKGAWYEMKEGEWDTCSEAKAEAYSRIHDRQTVTADLGNGENAVMQSVLASARGAVSERDIGLVAKGVKDGLCVGMGKYGPFYPKQETRNLLEWASEELRDSMVYAGMEIARDNPKTRPVMQEVIRECARLYVRVLRLSEGQAK